LQKVTHEYSAPASAPVPPEISAASDLRAQAGKWRDDIKERANVVFVGPSGGACGGE
jgi:hypothetical protein